MPGVLKHKFVSAAPEGTDASKVRTSNWNDEHAFAGGALGSLLYRDTAQSDGASWLADVAVGSVLVSGGVGVVPAWSASPTLTSLKVGNGSASTPSDSFVNDTDSGRYLLSPGTFAESIDGSAISRHSAAGLTLIGGAALGWESVVGNNNDLTLFRGGPDILEQRRGANPQTHRIANTYTDGANNEWFSITWGSNVVQLITSAVGTGTQRSMILGGTETIFQSGNPLASRVRFNTSGHFVPDSSNTINLGSSALPFASGYFGTAVAIGATPALTGTLRLPTSGSIHYRNAANTDDMRILVTDSVNGITIGQSNAQLDIASSATRFTNGPATSSHATGGIGYSTGAGGTVTQGAGSGKATAVTLNRAAGEITMDAASLAAGATVEFNFTNSAVTAADMVILTHHSVGSVGSYTLNMRAGAGGGTVSVRNNSAAALAEAIVIKFVVFKAATS